MSRFSRLMIVTGALLLMVFSASATDVRSATLGGAPYWKDAGDVDSWYGEIANYSDMAWVNFDALDGDGDPDATSLAMTKSEEGWGSFYLGIGNGAADKLTIGYGYGLEMATIGFVYDMYDAGDDSKFDFGFGIDYDMGDTNVDLAFDYGKDVDASSMGFAFRAFYAWRDGVTAVPVFAYGTTDDGADYTTTGMYFGLGFDYAINEDNSLVLGGNYSNWSDSDDASSTTMPGFYAGIEHDLYDWLTVRCAGTKSWDKDQDDTASYPFGFVFGMGLHVGDFDLDVAYREGALFDAFNWMLGGPGELGVYAVQMKYYF
ncbi:MAG: hypothetical protein QF492_07750 [Candidatus Krumholzibacteria bacterium]|nr:hypothetical protein [Candidatus Krumholzibacteria bacterium]